MKDFRLSKLTVITPVYQNASTLRALTSRVFDAAAPLFGEVEYLFVNDASPDDSRRVLADLAARDRRVKVLNFARNFGQHTAIMAGLRYARGDFVLLLDGDLEEPPETLPVFQAKLEEGYEVAIGIRSTPRSSPFKRTAARAFTVIFNVLSDYKIEGNTTSMRLMTRRFVEYMLRFNETPFLPGFTSWIGLPIGYVPVPWVEQARQSSYTLKRLLHHARTGIIGFSTTIMRKGITAGLVTSGLSIAYGIVAVVRYFMLDNVAPGFTTIVALLTFLMGMQLIFIGVLGEYVMEIFKAVKRRPSFLVYDTFNLEIDGPGS